MPSKKHKNAPLSLAGISVEDALRAAMQVPPMKKPKKKKVKKVKK